MARKAKPSFKLLSLIVCDDIREEAGTGKHILIGVYKDFIGFTEPGVLSKICVRVQIQLLEADARELMFQIRDEHGDVKADMKAEIPKQQPGSTVFTCVAHNLAVQQNAEMKFWVGINQDIPVEIGSIGVRVGPREEVLEGR